MQRRRVFDVELAEPFAVLDDVEVEAEIAVGGGLATTRSITVRTVAGEPYERIVDYELGPRPEPIPAGSPAFDEEDCPF